MKIPKLKDMIKIDGEVINTIQMFPDAGWEALNKKIRSMRLDYSSPNDLADGFQVYVEIWCQYHLKDDIDITNPIAKVRKNEVFLSNEGEFYFFHGDLYQTLLNRWAEYTLGD